MLNLIHEVVEVELILLNLLLKPACLLLIELLLSSLHKADNIAHSENTVGHTLGVEHVDSFHLLARSYKLNRLRNHRAYRKSRTATGIAVEFGQDHAVKVQTVVKFLSRIHGILSCHGVDNKQCLVGIDVILQALYLVHHLLIHRQSACRIDDNSVIAFCLRLADGIVGNLVHILVIRFAIYRYAHLLANDHKLLDGCRTIYVASYEQRFLVLLVLEHIGELSAKRGLTRTLQTAHQDYRRPAFELQFHSLATHQTCQLVMYELHHQLTRLHSRQHVHTQSLLLHGIGKCFGNFIVNVGIKQRATHIFQSFRNVYLGNLSLSLKYLKRAFKSIT